MKALENEKDRNHTVAQLQNNIEDAISILGTGFIQNTSNTKLRAFLDKESENRQHFYRLLVRLLFQCIVLSIAEDRNLLFSPEVSKETKKQYMQKHSIQRLQQFSVNDLKQENVWRGLILIMNKLYNGCSILKLPALKSFLWSPSSRLTTSSCENEYIVRAIHALKGTKHNLINWCSISAKELGSIYESLLELHLEIDTTKQSLTVSSKEGHERKSTGSYYTPDSLIECLLNATLQPAISKACKNKIKKEQESALLKLRICDPSCGSGMFLIAASQHLAQHLAQIRSDIQAPTKEELQQATQDVIRHCIYGVDLNPMSVELCKISLWMEMNAPLNTIISLHMHIQCGNALLGIQREQIKDGIRPDFFTLVKENDDKTVRNRIAAKNRKEYKKREHLNARRFTNHAETIISDVILAAMLWPKISEANWESAAPTQNTLSTIMQGDARPQTMKYVQKLKKKHRFFHWHLAFPSIFSSGGFHVVIGNPPYLDSEFLTKNLPYQRVAIPHLYASARGNWDIYIPFTELGLRLLKPGGFHAFVTPNKILGADYSAALHQTSFFAYQLKEVHDFSHLSLFDGASVAVVIVVTEKKEANPNKVIDFYQYKTNTQTITNHTKTALEQLKKLPAGFISFPITSPEAELLSWINQDRSIIDIAHVSDGATAGEAYEIQPMVHTGTDSDWTCEDKLKLVNTGTIDPFALLWKQKRISYLGFKGVCPVIDAQAFQKKFPRRYAQAMSENIVIAGMSKRLEAAVAPKSFLCGKSAVLIQPKESICPYALTVLLNSKSFVNLYRGLFAMRGMSGTSLNIGPRQIERLPIPDLKYLQEYTDVVDINQSVVSTSTICNRLSLLGKILHIQHLQHTIDIAEQTVRSIMNQEH